MTNISKDKLLAISSQTGDLLKEIDNSIRWVNDYLKDEDCSEASYALKKVRRELKKIRFSITQKPAAALYGESQVGKSYLIKNLLSTPGHELEIEDVSSFNTPYNFLEHINPKGDQTEATSLVTRFSIDQHYIDDRYPVKINLLSPKDIVLFLLDSYYSDIKDHVCNPKIEEINQEIEALSNNYKNNHFSQHFLTEDDILDIKDYLEDNFRISVDRFTSSNFWIETSQVIQNVPPHEWSNFFQIIWGKLPSLTNIFQKLVNELVRIQFQTVVYAEFKCILRKYGTILHVARLREIELGPVYEDVPKDNYLPNVAIMYDNNGQKTELSINKSILCALCGELILQVKSSLAEEKIFLNNSDLLDFPGARSRLENKESSINKDHIDLMVLRGKVSYIFNKYSSERLVSNLLFCNKDAKVEVTYIPKLLNNWISYYIGDTSEERALSLKNTPVPPIFIIFTFFNNDLKFNEKNDTKETLIQKWTKRFVTIFENEIITNNFNWHKNWTSDNPRFKNFYLLRDFTHSKETYTGFSEHKEEVNLSNIYFGDKFSGHEDYFQQVTNSFLDFPFVKEHFDNPLHSWNEAASINKDGSEWIIKQLTLVSSNKVRSERFVRLINQLQSQALRIIEKHFHNDAADEQIKIAARTGADIHANMNVIFSKNPFNFGNFVKKLTISEHSIFNFYHDELKKLDLINKTNINQYIYFRESSPNLSKTKSYEENLEVLKLTYLLQDASEVESYFAEKNIDLNELFYGDETSTLKNNSLALAEGLRDYWFDNYLVPERFQSFINDGFSKAALGKLLDNFKVNFTKQRIVNEIADYIKHYVDRYAKLSNAEEMIADISAGLINKFVNSVGWDFYTENELQKIWATNNANQLNLVLPNSIQFVFDPCSKEELCALFDDMEHLNENLSQIPPKEEAIKNVSVIRQYRRWRDLMKVSFVANCDIPTYNVEGNKKLRVIIDQIKVHKFSIS